MQYFVEDRGVPGYFLVRQAMNFGQPWPATARPLRYRVLVEGKEFISKMQAELERAREEEIADAPFHQPGEAPELDRWKELGYPPIGELLAHHPQVLERVLHWLDLETLDRILPYDEARCRYVVNTLERVKVADGVVCFEGLAYERIASPGGPAPSRGVGQQATQGG